MIKFNNIKAGFKLNDPVFFRNWLKQVVNIETERKVGEIQYVFCDDKYLLAINKKYLNHNSLTDIITFPFDAKNVDYISGEIYISIDRITENAKKYDNSFQKELSRVIVHGLLHLLGYKDHKQSEKEKMRQKEDYYLNLQPQKIS